MISIDVFRDLVADSLNLSVLVAFAREVPSVRTEFFCEEGEPEQSLNDSPDESQIEAPAENRVTNTVTRSVPAETNFVSRTSPPPGVVNLSGVDSAMGSTATAPVSRATPPAPREGRVTFTSVPSQAPAVPAPAAGPSVSPFATQRATFMQPAAPASKSAEDAPFVFGDFAMGDLSSSSSLPLAPLMAPWPSTQHRKSRTAIEDMELASFGDFSYFVPVSSDQCTNKVEQSLNRSLIKRSASISHRVLDELELEDDSEQDASQSKDNFSFGDFSITETYVADAADSRSSSARDFSAPQDEEGAFMFGDFMVAMPDAQRAKPKTVAPQKPAAPKPPLGVSRQAVSRTVRRPPISLGTLVRDVIVTPVLGHSARVRGAVMASDAENCVVSVGGGQLVQLRSFTSPTPLKVFVGHQDQVLHIAISSDLNLIATSGSDGLLSIFEVSTSKLVGECTHTTAVLCATFSKNGKYVVSGSEDCLARLWASRKKHQATPMNNYFGHRALITCCAFQPVGDLVASGSADAQLHVWSASTAKAIHTLSKIHSNPVLNVAFNAEGTLILSCDSSRVVVTEANSGAPAAVMEASLKPKYFFTGACFAPQQQYPNYFFVAGSDRQLTLYEFQIAPFPSSASKTVAATPVSKGAGKKGEKSGSSAPAAAQEFLVTISSEVWSTDFRHRICWVSSGFRHTVVVGDLGGNLAVVRLTPRAGEARPSQLQANGKPQSDRMKE